MIRKFLIKILKPTRLEAKEYSLDFAYWLANNWYKPHGNPNTWRIETYPWNGVHWKYYSLDDLYSLYLINPEQGKIKKTKEP